MDLPNELRLALATELVTATPKALAQSAGALSARYRDPEGERAGPLVRSESDVAAYAAARLPATFAATHAALEALGVSVPALRPASLLDAGAGPGTASWAALQHWPEISRVALLERDAAMIALGRRLARHASSPALREASWHRLDVVSGEWDSEQSDLVVAAYMVGEAPEAARDGVVARLWDAAAEALVIVEPGTPRGFAVIRCARAALIAASACVAAPCPHDGDCPMPAGDWCHFAQRLTRTPLQRGVKAGTLSYEDEKYSYVAAIRRAEPGRASRVLRHPQTRKGHITLDLCTLAGLQRRTVSRREGALYRQARDVSWGSTFATSTSDEGDDEAVY